MKKILTIVLFFFLISCLNPKSDVKKNSDVFYFMFEKPPINNSNSSNKRICRHEFINDDYEDTVATNDELINYTHLDTMQTRFFDSIKTSNNYRYDRQRFLDSIKAAINYYDRRINETFYKRTYDSSICYTYRHEFTIDYDDAFVLCELIHNIGLDTIFIKHEAFLDSISVINNGSFLEDVGNESTLWKGGPHFLKEDTIDIFVIERIANTDSFVFRKVNRNLMPWL